MPMTYNEVHAYVVDVINSNLRDVAMQAGVPCFEPYKSTIYSNLLWEGLDTDLDVIEAEEYVHEFRMSRDFDLCTNQGLIIIEFVFDEDTQDPETPKHDLRYEVVDQFYVSES